MWLAVLQLWHGRRSGDADPELAAVEGSDPPFWDASIGIGEGRHVHAHATLHGGSLPSESIPADCLGYLRNSFIMIELHIRRRSPTPHYIHRFQSDFLGLSWPSTDVTVRSSRGERRVVGSCGGVR